MTHGTLFTVLAVDISHFIMSYLSTLLQNGLRSTSARVVPAVTSEGNPYLGNLHSKTHYSVERYELLIGDVLCGINFCQARPAGLQLMSIPRSNRSSEDSDCRSRLSVIIFFFVRDNGMMHMTSKWLDLESVSATILTASANIPYGDQGVDR
jgi:hypothetical protein